MLLPIPSHLKRGALIPAPVTKDIILTSISGVMASIANVIDALNLNAANHAPNLILGVPIHPVLTHEVMIRARDLSANLIVGRHAVRSHANPIVERHAVRNRANLIVESPVVGNRANLIVESPVVGNRANLIVESPVVGNHAELDAENHVANKFVHTCVSNADASPRL
jgi:hypothetical protein